MSGPGSLDGTLPMASDAASASASATASVAHLIAGRYQVCALLGAGAMGSVYEVRDVELDERVALKLMRRELARVPGLIERFRQEVKLARKVTSPNVARVFDIGEHDDERFLTMELVIGESLGALLSRGSPLDLADVTRIMGCVCDGLAAAHTVGVVHCDLKPDNVLLARDGGIKITDFGIARAQADLAVSRSVMAGTPAYMAPEQVTGEGLDARSDIYALGVMLFEMLAGEEPWKGPNVVAIAAARLLRPPPDPRSKRRDVPVGLAELVMKCMARDPRARPASAREVAEELRRYATGALTPSAPMRVALRGAQHQCRVAVLPFRGSRLEDDLLADGLTDQLIGVLATAQNVRVRARGSIARFTGADVDPSAAGRELDVHVVIEGRVERAGDDVTVLARLVGVEDGFAITTVRAVGRVTGILALADDIGAAIARALSANLVPRHGRALDSEALDLLLRGRRAYRRFTRESADESVRLLRSAASREPGDPVILAALSMALLRSLVVGGPPTALDEAEEVAVEALRHGPMLSDAHLAQSRIFLSRMAEARAARELRAAIELSPSNAEAVALFGRILGECGLLEEGIDRLQNALRLDEGMVLARIDLGRLFALRGDVEVAGEILACDDLRETYLLWTTRLRCALWRRDLDQAREVVLLLRQATVPSASVGRLVTFVDEPTLVPPAPKGGTPRRQLFETQLTAEMALVASRDEEALEAVEAASALGLCDLSWLERCPLLDRLRGSPRFEASRRRVEERAAELRAVLLGEPGAD